jgi:PST family polysaccharide transporter
MLNKAYTFFLPIVEFLEKKFKIDAHYVLRNNFWLNLNRGFSILCGLILSVAYAHFLSKEQYGLYAYALTVIGLFSMPVTTALGAGISKEVARQNYSVIFEGLRRLQPWSLVAAIALVALGGYYAFADHFELAICFALGGIAIPSQVYGGAAKSFLSCNGDLKMITTYNLYRTPVFTFILASVAWFSQSALYVVIANIVVNAIISFGFYRTVAHTYNFNAIERKDGFFAGSYSFHSAIISILNYIAEKIDGVLLWKFVGAAPVALYAYASNPVKEILALISNQSIIAIPKFAQKSFDEVRANIHIRIKQLYLFAIPLMIAYIACAPLLFKYLFPQYIEATFLSQLVALSILSAPRRLLQAAISAHQHTKATYVTNIVPNVVRIICAVILVPIFGIIGAVFALLISEAIDYIVLGILMKNIKVEEKTDLQPTESQS